MGCGISTNAPAVHNAEKSIKAALLIQMWYRRYLARLEARRLYTWNIFQTLEYAGEQDQLRLYNFFNDMITQMQIASINGDGNQQSGFLSLLQVTANSVSGKINDEKDDLFYLTDPAAVIVSDGYKGPRLTFPITNNQIECLIQAFKKKQVLHAHYLFMLLHECRKAFKLQSNIHQISTKNSQQVTVVGDLHGKLDDLLIILYKNGLPETRNPYVFNGDFVDRGPNSVEICVLLFACFLANPASCYINRGNHEDHSINIRYGFTKEIMSKYKTHAAKLIRLFNDVFSWLPLAAIIDDNIFVCHGGISDETNIEYLQNINRHKYISILRPSVTDDDDDDNENADKEWRQMLDLLWSDPKSSPGCCANKHRGGGSYFGPDVTEAFMDKHNLELLIRSHECKPEGYEYDHNNKVLTVFSASNYYEIGSNKGAYVKIAPNTEPRIVQYIATKQDGRRLTFKQRVTYVEASALRSLKEKVLSNKSVLLEEFLKYDTEHTGLIRFDDWRKVMSDVLNMGLPWRNIAPQLVNYSENGMVRYNSTFDEYKLETKYDEHTSPATESLYRNKESLETMFRAIDKDKSGYISMEEFQEACIILAKHTGNSFSMEHIAEMARNIDLNKDGRIDFNEFLEAFRIVDRFGKDISRRRSKDSVASTESDDTNPQVSEQWSPQKANQGMPSE